MKHNILRIYESYSYSVIILINIFSINKHEFYV